MREVWDDTKQDEPANAMQNPVPPNVKGADDKNKKNLF